MPAGLRGSMRSFGRDQSVKDAKVAPETFRRIVTLAVPYRSLLGAFLLVVIVDAVIGVINPLIYREIINRGIVHGDVNLIIKLAFLVAGLAVVDAGLSMGQRFLSSRIGFGLVYDMRVKIFAHVQRMSLAFFTRIQTGALVSRLNNDVTGAQEAFTDVLSNIVGNLISVALVLSAMLVLSWKLTLVALIMLPIFVLPARRLGARFEQITRERYDLGSEINSIMIERFNVSGALLSKLFGQASTENASFQEKAGRVRDIAITQSLLGRLLFVSLSLTAALATALVYGWGGVLAAHKLLDVGTVIALTAYLGRLYQPLTTLSNIQVDVMTALVSFERVFEVLDLPPLITEKPHAKDLTHGPAKIIFEHVGFHYPAADEVSLASLESVAILDKTQEKEVLKDVSFTVQPGQMVALVGPSGAGKTTITQLVARLYDVQQGSVKINDIDIKDLSLDSLQRVIGMVTQEAHMFHESIRSNLLYAKPDATDAELRTVLESAQILKLVDSLPNGLETMVGNRGYRLSGGEKQRLAIARLLLKAPDIIILDEATAHLDSESEQAIQRAFEIALTDRTSLVIAHRLSTIQKADTILVVDGGRIVESGSHAELLERGGVYAGLYHTQFAKAESWRA